LNGLFFDDFNDENYGWLSFPHTMDNEVLEIRKEYVVANLGELL
jgi:hypothetical protein